jgi:hypothetical protein
MAADFLVGGYTGSGLVVRRNGRRRCQKNTLVFGRKVSWSGRTLCGLPFQLADDGVKGDGLRPRRGSPCPAARKHRRHIPT